MIRRSMIGCGRNAVVVACGIVVAVGLAACQQTTPSGELWPNQPLTDFGDPWVPALFTAENADAFGDVIAIRRAYVDASAATVIENLDRENRISVHYIDRNDSRQVVDIEPGDALAVAAQPRRIVSVRR